MKWYYLLLISWNLTEINSLYSPYSNDFIYSNSLISQSSKLVSNSDLNDYSNANNNNNNNNYLINAPGYTTGSTTTTNNNMTNYSNNSNNSNNGNNSMTISYKENKVINGLNYSPFNTNNNCKTQSDMETDLILINKMTNKIRLYSNDCNQIEMVLQIIAQKRLSMKVLLGIWIRGGQQKIEQGSSAIINVLTKNPSYANYVLGVTVGNEELFNGMNVNQLVNNIIYVRQQFQKNKINNVIISTVEVGDKWCDQLVKVCDTVFANLYSYFGPNPTPSNDITQVMTQAVQSVLDQATNLINKYQRNVTISETGWPSNGSPDKNQATFAPASIQNQALFLKGFICKAKKMNLDYYLLEALDSTWKSGPSIEKNFGIMDQNHNFKGFNPLLLSC